MVNTSPIFLSDSALKLDPYSVYANVHPNVVYT